MRRAMLAVLMLAIPQVLTFPGMAAVPNLVNYQGILTDTDGHPLNGTYDLTFKIYPDSLTATPPLWTEQHMALSISNGLFAAVLGSLVPIPEELFSGAERWFGITVNSGPELLPRIRLTAVPYAHVGAVADSAGTVAWDGIVNMPQGFADGVDDTGGAGGDGHSLDAADGDPEDALFVDDDGNVGIGTVTPTERLDVAGNLHVSDAVHLTSSMNQLVFTSGIDDWFIMSKGAPADNLALGVYSPSDDGGLYYGWNFFTRENGDVYMRGNVGIGTETPGQKLDVSGSLAVSGSVFLTAAMDQIRFTSSTDDWWLMSKGGPTDDLALALLSPGDDGGSYDGWNFYVKENGNVYLKGNVGIGTTEPSTKLHVVGTTTTNVLTITGGSDIAEPFPIIDSDNVPEGAVVVIDERSAGRLRMSDRPYDRKVAGVVSGAGGIHPGVTLTQQDNLIGGKNVALTGRVYALADASYGSIAVGDLLTTSATPGHAMIAKEFARSQGAILGKAMSPLPEGRGLVLVLVNLQ